MAILGVKTPMLRTASGKTVMVRGLQETLRDLDAIARNGGADLAVIHADVAMTVRNWQLRHFDRAENSMGVRWPALSKLTLMLRRGGGAKPLQDTGALKASVAVQSSSVEGWIVGTRRRFAAVHQWGKTIFPKNGKFLFIPVDGKGNRARSFASSLVMGGKRGQRYGELTKTGKAKRRLIALRKAVIPSREFIYMNTNELSEMVQIYASEVAARGTTYIKWSGLRRSHA